MRRPVPNGTGLPAAGTIWRRAKLPLAKAKATPGDESTARGSKKCRSPRKAWLKTSDCHRRVPVARLRATRAAA